MLLNHGIGIVLDEEIGIQIPPTEESDEKFSAWRGWDSPSPSVDRAARHGHRKRLVRLLLGSFGPVATVVSECLTGSGLEIGVRGEWFRGGNPNFS